MFEKVDNVSEWVEQRKKLQISEEINKKMDEVLKMKDKVDEMYSLLEDAETVTINQ